MKSELSHLDLDHELIAALPARELMRRHRSRARVHAHAHASFGSGANANATHQVNSNPQTVVNVGGLGSSNLTSHNSNHNTTNQNAVPINFSI